MEAQIESVLLRARGKGENDVIVSNCHGNFTGVSSRIIQVAIQTVKTFTVCNEPADITCSRVLTSSAGLIATHDQPNDSDKWVVFCCFIRAVS